MLACFCTGTQAAAIPCFISLEMQAAGQRIPGAGGQLQIRTQIHDDAVCFQKTQLRHVHARTKGLPYRQNDCKIAHRQVAGFCDPHRQWSADDLRHGVAMPRRQWLQSKLIDIFPTMTMISIISDENR